MQEAIQHQAMEDLHRLLQLLTIRYIYHSPSPPLHLPVSLILAHLHFWCNFAYHLSQSSCIG